MNFLKCFLILICGIFLNAQETEKLQYKDHIVYVKEIGSKKFLKENQKMKLVNIAHLDSVPRKDFEGYDFINFGKITLKDFREIFDFHSSNFYKKSKYYLLKQNTDSLIIDVFMYENEKDNRNVITQNIKEKFPIAAVKYINKNQIQKGLKNNLRLDIEYVPSKLRVKIPYSEENKNRINQWINENKNRWDIRFVNPMIKAYWLFYIET